MSFLEFFREYIISFLIGGYEDLPIQIFDWSTSLGDIVTIMFGLFFSYGICMLVVYVPICKFRKLIWKR